MSPKPTRNLLCLLIGAVLQITWCLAAEPSPVPAPSSAPAIPKDELILQLYQIPRDVFVDPCNASKSSAKEFFTNLGVPFPPGSDMAVDQIAGLLTVRQTKENLELIEAICSASCYCPPCIIKVQISAFRCASSTLAKLQANKQLTDESLTSLGSSLVLLDRVSCISKSGQEVDSNSIYYFSSTPSTVAPACGKSTPFQPGEFGTKAYLQTIVEADGATISFKLRYHLRVPISEAARTAVVDVNVKSDFLATDGHPLLIKSASLPSLSTSDSPAETQKVVVIFRPSRVEVAAHQDLLRKLPTSNEKVVQKN